MQVGSREAKYNFNAINTSKGGGANALDPYHTVYLLTDDGTHGTYSYDPQLRTNLENYIKECTTIEMMGDRRMYWLGVNT